MDGWMGGGMDGSMDGLMNGWRIRRGRKEVYGLT